MVAPTRLVSPARLSIPRRERGGEYVAALSWLSWGPREDEVVGEPRSRKSAAWDLREPSRGRGTRAAAPGATPSSRRARPLQPAPRYPWAARAQPRRGVPFRTFVGGRAAAGAYLFGPSPDATTAARTSSLPPAHEHPRPAERGTARYRKPEKKRRAAGWRRRPRSPPLPPQVPAESITSTSLDAATRPAPTKEVFCTCCGSTQTPWTKGCRWAP